MCSPPHLRGTCGEAQLGTAARSAGGRLVSGAVLAAA